MTELDPVLTVLLYSSVAAFAAGLGVLPQLIRGEMSMTMLGWGNALAAGLMLGVAYTLLTAGLDGALAALAAGSLLGMGFVRLTHLVTGTAELDLNRLDEVEPAYGYQVVLVNSLHGGYEGVAIGVAMAVSLPFGIFMAAALAVHNVPEGMILTSILRSRGVKPLQAAALAVATNANQVLVSVVVFVLVGAVPALLPWALGVAVGALLYLIFSELLPESYAEAGHTSIALVTLLAMAVVVGLG